MLDICACAGVTASKAPTATTKHDLVALETGVDGPVKPGHDGIFVLAMMISPKIHSSIGQMKRLINKKVF
jgi:hypothetical protein